MKDDTLLFLDREDARDLLYGGDNDHYEVEADLYIESRRWVSSHQLVIMNKHDDTYWSAQYDRGLTEYQDHQPWEDESTVRFDKVEKIPVTTYEYN